MRDKGFAGRDFEHLVTTGYGLHLVRPDRRDEAPHHGSIGWIPQWIESVNDTLKGQLDLERHGWPHHRRALHPDRPAAAGHGRLHLAQLGSRRSGQALAYRIRPPNPPEKEVERDVFIESSSPARPVRRLTIEATFGI